MIIMSNTNLPSIKLKELMADSKKIILKHGDKPYLLSITRRGKLILTASEEPSTSSNISALTSG
ncbi:hemin uptake protein HemP [Leucothrix sargassi]|nr:hemin uptake protein HemP [Leucothrix sargassi]